MSSQIRSATSLSIARLTVASIWSPSIASSTASLEPAVLDQAGDRPLDGGALERPDDRLLDGDLDGAVDAGRAGEPADAPGAALEQPAADRHLRPGAVGCGRSRHSAASLCPARISRRRSAAAPRAPRRRRRRGSRGRPGRRCPRACASSRPAAGPGPKLEIDQVDGRDPRLEERDVVVLDAGRPRPRTATGRRRRTATVETRVGVGLARDREVAVADHVEQHHRLDLRRAAAFPACLGLRIGDVLAAAAGAVDLEVAVAAGLLAVEQRDRDRRAPASDSGSDRASSRTTATPEAPSLAPTKPGIPGLVSWWAPITTQPSPRPGDRPDDVALAGAGSGRPRRPAARSSAASIRRSARRSPPIPPGAARARPARGGRRTPDRRRSASPASPGTSRRRHRRSRIRRGTRDERHEQRRRPRTRRRRAVAGLGHARYVRAMPQGHMDRLTSIDASFLTNESPTSHMHIGGVTIFEGPPPSYEDLLDHIESRLHLVPRYRQKLAVPAGRDRPAVLGRRPAVQPRLPRAPLGPARPRRRGRAAPDGRPRLLPAARPDQAALGAVARRGPPQAPLRADLQDPPRARRRRLRRRHRHRPLRRQAGARAGEARPRLDPEPEAVRRRARRARRREPREGADRRRPARRLGGQLPEGRRTTDPGRGRGRRRGRLGVRQPGSRPAAQHRRSARTAATPGCAAIWPSSSGSRPSSAAPSTTSSSAPSPVRCGAGSTPAASAPRASSCARSCRSRSARPTSAASSATRSPPSAARCPSTSRIRSPGCGRSARPWTASSRRRRRSGPR